MDEWLSHCSFKAEIAGSNPVGGIVYLVFKQSDSEFESLTIHQIRVFGTTVMLLTLNQLALRTEMTPDEVISHLTKMRNVCDRYKEGNSQLRHNVMSQPQTQIIEELFTSLARMSWESFVKNRLPLLNLPADVLEALRSGTIEYTKARAIARVGDDETRKELLENAITYNLSLKEIKRKIKEIEQQVKTETPSIKDQVDLYLQGVITT